jgi:acyl transferase domain-containing protein
VDDTPKVVESDQPVTYVFGCSARSHDILQQARDELLMFLDDPTTDLRVSDVCYTSTARRGLQSYRISTTATTIEELITGLQKAQIVEASDSPRSTAFLFSGQGSQYLGMGEELMELLQTFRKTVLSCHYLLGDWGFPSCLDVICPTEGQELDLHDADTIQAFQSGVFTLEVALAKSLIELGLQASLVAGHSLGEFAALVIAGVLDMESGLWLVAQRASLIVGQCDLFQSTMLAVNMPAAEVRKSILRRDEFSGISISCENSPGDCVVGGKKADLERLQQYLSNDPAKKSAQLDVPVAYHTAALEPMLDELKMASDTLTFSPPNVAIASNVLGRVVGVGERDVFNSQYFSDHCSKTVAFSDSIADAMGQDETLEGARWIEIGPHPMLLPMVSYVLCSYQTIILMIRRLSNMALQKDQQH